MSDNKTTPLGATSEEANSLVNAPTGNDGDKVAVFTTPQSLATFPGATAIVTIIWNVLAQAFPSLESETGNRVLSTLIIAFIISLVIYLNSVAKRNNWRKTISEILIALINSFVIAAAVLGISSTIKTNKSKEESPQNPPSNTQPANSAATSSSTISIATTLTCEFKEELKFSEDKLIAVIKGCGEEIKKNPDSINAFFNRALSYHNLGLLFKNKSENKELQKADQNFSAAIDDYGKVIEFDNSKTAAYINRGDAYVERNKQGDSALAITDFQKAIETLDSRNDEVSKKTKSQIFLNLGYAYNMNGKTTDAITAFKKVCEICSSIKENGSEECKKRCEEANKGIKELNNPS